MAENNRKILCQNLWKVFGAKPESVFDLANNGVTKQEILEQTGHVIAVKDVSFEVHENEIFVVMGLSGSGKSTLIRCINRLVEPTRGRILVDGVDIAQMNGTELKELRRHKLSMVFQNFGLLPHRSVLSNVVFGLELRGEDKKERQKKAIQVLETVGLAGWEESWIYELSGGMQQRVGLARALAVDPEILLMDEPFSGLDPLIRRQMQDELLGIQEELHKTILFVTHDLDEALKLGNRIAIMKDGEIIQIGSPEEVITTPSDAYVREFVQDASPAKVVTAGSIMEQPNVLLYEWQGPKAAMHMLRTNHLDNAFLVNRMGRLLGLVTLERLIELFRNNGNSLREALEPDLPTATADMVIEDLFPLVASTGYPVPVVDDSGRFMGEIHYSTILLSMIQEKASETGAEEEVAAKETVD